MAAAVAQSERLASQRLAELQAVWRMASQLRELQRPEAVQPADLPGAWELPAEVRQQ
jgi:hypothetical protein